MNHQLYLFFFIVLFYFVTFVLRSFLVWKNTGINPFIFEGKDDAHGFNGQLFKFVAVLELVIIAIYSFGENRSEYLLPFWYLEKNYLKIIGWGLLHFSLGWIIVAQYQMSNSWRIGIDEKNKSALITHGLFSISRNPIFFGILLANLGVFFIVPNAFTLVVLVLSYAVIQTQVRLEESFLKKMYGGDYQKYFERVKRWI